MTRPILALALLSVVTTSSFGCGGCSARSAPGDGGVLVDGDVDGSFDPDAAVATPFDPTVTYPGEHALCRFSVQCTGASQICVDGECVRHERFAADELAFGEWRRMTDTELWLTPMYLDVETPWSDFDGAMGGAQLGPSWGITSWLVPSADGNPAMVFHAFHADHCQFGVYGASLRMFSLPDMACTAITASDDGWVAAGGVRTDTHANHLVVWNPARQKVVDMDVPADADARVRTATNWGAGSAVGQFTSLYFSAGKLYATAARGEVALNNYRGWTNNTHSNALRNGDVVHLEVDLGAATMIVHPIGGKDVQPGRFGWIVEESGALFSLYSHHVGPNVGDVSLEKVRWSDGTRTTLASQFANTGRYFQPSHDRWVFHLDWSPACYTSVFDPSGLVRMVRMAPADFTCPTPSEYEYNGGTREDTTLWGPWPNALGFTTNAGVAVYDSEYAFMEGIFLRWSDDTFATVESETLAPPVAFSPRVALVSRFEKSVEGAYVDDGRPNFLGWIERSLVHVP